MGGRPRTTLPCSYCFASCGNRYCKAPEAIAAGSEAKAELGRRARGEGVTVRSKAVTLAVRMRRQTNSA